MPATTTQDDSPRPEPDGTWPTVKGLVTGQKLFGRYSLEKVLGRGGMGIVWLSRDERLNRYVALKVLPEEFFYDQAARDDLKHETRKSLELTHPNIVRIHDFIEDDKGVAISMEFVDGYTLSEMRLQQESKLLEADALSGWIVGVCEALHYAHTSAKMVHRDLKPANIMVTRRGNVKITDFGIACSLHNSLSRVSMRQTSSGTIVYMSPEQMMGEQPSPLDDIYSLGATIYEAMTSKPPFYAGDIASQVSRKDPVSMAERRRELDLQGKLIPKEWEKTIAKCLSKDRRKRPQNPMELMQMLGLSPSSSTATAAFSIRKNAEPAAKKEGNKTLIMTSLGIAALGALFIFKSLFSGPNTSQAAANTDPSPSSTPAFAGVTAAVPAASPSGHPAQPNPLPVTSTPLNDAQYLASETTGRLELATDPAGAGFKIFAGKRTDNTTMPGTISIRSGMTPANVDGLPLGVLTVVFSRQGWNDQVREVDLKKEGTKTEATFTIAKLSVTTKPAGGGIVFDDRLVGISPLVLEVPPGQHKITATLQGKAPQSQDVWITEGEESNVEISFGGTTTSAPHKRRSTAAKPTPSGWDKLGNSLKKIFSPSSSKDKKKSTTHK